MDFFIRHVSLSDANSLVNLMNPILLKGCYSTMSGPLNLLEQEKFILELSTESVYLAAVSESMGEIIGAQDILPESEKAAETSRIGHISTFIEMNSHRQGIGSALWQRSHNEAIKKGYRKLFALVRSDNPNAISFYSSLGFKTIQILKNYAAIKDKTIDGVKLEYQL